MPAWGKSWGKSWGSAWGALTQPYVDLTHAERVYVRTLLHKAYVEASVAQIVIHAEKFNVSVLEAIEQMHVVLKLKQDRVLTIFDKVTHLSKLAEEHDERQDVVESLVVQMSRNEEVVHARGSSESVRLLIMQQSVFVQSARATNHR